MVSVPTQTADAWWAGVPLPMKIFLQDLVRLLEDLRSDDVLTIRYNGHSFLPILMTHRKLGAESCPINRGMAKGPDEWWGALSADKKRFVPLLNKSATELKLNEVLEYKAVGRMIQSSLIEYFPAPNPSGQVGGKPELN